MISVSGTCLIGSHGWAVSDKECSPTRDRSQPQFHLASFRFTSAHRSYFCGTSSDRTLRSAFGHRTSTRSPDHRLLCLVVFLSSKESLMDPRTYMLRLACILAQTHVSLEHYPLIYLLSWPKKINKTIYAINLHDIKLVNPFTC